MEPWKKYFSIKILRLHNDLENHFLKSPHSDIFVNTILSKSEFRWSLEKENHVQMASEEILGP